ncbi:MAG: hypothetical protein DWP94_03195 [Flavobacterium sp.]|nr:MAG: hypothetical protein DWP94_03195 [Flavobacterium sp.]
MRNVLTIFIYICLSSVYSQDLDPGEGTPKAVPANLVYGVVYNESGPIQGAIVRIKGTFEETRTAANGMYRIMASKGEVLEIRALGMLIKDTMVDESRKIHIPMKPDGELLETIRILAKKSEKETVNTAFGEKKKAAVGYSTRNTINREEIRSDQLELWQILQKMPGVVVENPGGPNPMYKLRRTMEITIHGTTYPVLVVNGMLFEQNGQQPYVNVQQIKSIKVLNSLNATIKYGQLAAFGAIVIETDQGPERESVEQPQLKRLSGNNYTEIVSTLDEASGKSPKPEYVVRLEKTENFDQAREVYLDMLKDTKHKSVSFFLDTGDYFRKWDTAYANEVVSQIAEIAPTNVKALKSLAYAYEAYGKDELATPIYERIVNLAPSEVQSYLDLARNYKRVGNYQLSATLYKQMVANSIPKVDFNEVGVIVFNEFKQLIALHKSKIDFSDIPNELMKVGFKKDLRLVVEWNDPLADFELQFITPNKKYYPYLHNLYGDQQALQKEIEQGFSIKEFDIEDADRGTWMINIKYSGMRDDINPTLLKYTLYRNYGLPTEERVVKIVKLQDFEEKVTLHTFVY